MVVLGKVVFTSREHIIALEARDEGMLGVTLRYLHEVRDQAAYFESINDEKIPKDMCRNEARRFPPETFEDDYEQALREIIEKKGKGEKIKRPKQPAPSNVVNLMDALRASVKAESGGAPRKVKRPEPRTAKKKRPA
jgi:DNA end-binding protein Ku